ncbi:EH domain-containing protein 4 [Grus japonensis]|uniref:EH domain-containing protein 4 n=1 Tax=Grus japonensis TaxID=30415 RepID=A0ABC9VZC7_GRUJA
MVEQRFDLQPVEDPMLEQVDAPEGGCDPVGSPCWSRLLAGPVALKRGAHARAGLLAGLVTLCKGPTLEQLVKSCSPWEGFMLKLVEDCLLWEGPHTGAGEECEESSP